MVDSAVSIVARTRRIAQWRVGEGGGGRETERQTKRQKKRETDVGGGDRETERQRDRETKMQKQREMEM